MANVRAQATAKHLAVDGGRELATVLDHHVDRGLIGGSGIGMGKLSEWIYSILNRFQSGLVRMYALSMLAGVVGIIALVLYLNNGGAR